MSIFPFISPELLAEAARPALPMFREYAYDFQTKRLLLRNGSTYLVEGNEALRIWIYKALATQRFRYIAYDADFGSEQHTLVGSTINTDIKHSELKRFIVEALMVNPYIRELTNFTFTAAGSLVAVSFDCITIYGPMTIPQEFEVS